MHVSAYVSRRAPARAYGVRATQGFAIRSDIADTNFSPPANRKRPAGAGFADRWISIRSRRTAGLTAGAVRTKASRGFSGVLRWERPRRSRGGQVAPEACEREKREAIRGPDGHGHVQGACRQDRELSGRVEPGREEVGLGQKSIPRRDDRAEEGRRAKGRQGDRAQAQLAPVGSTTGDRIRTLERGVPSGGPCSLRPYG
jgi:hypothetical protein